VVSLCCISPLTVQANACDDWPLWQAFGNRFIQPDGRVLADESEQRYSTSEGQAYALFFSLVANDRNKFDRILVWTSDNLAARDLAATLPAWQWGKRPDGSWGVTDQNPASDADVWLAYTLLEAGRLWHEERYTALGKVILANIRIHEIREFQGGGSMLLPAPAGFNLEQNGARFNPSYLPVQVLRSFARIEPLGPWTRVIESSVKLVQQSSPKGFVPDWSSYIPSQGYLADAQQGAKGSYDAIRVYLWWGMLSQQDSMAAPLKKALFGMNQIIPRQAVSPPASVDTQTGLFTGVSPPGFSAALVPYFLTMKNVDAVRLQRDRLISQRDTATGILIGHPPRYYDQVLTLFGLGWMERRFSFSVNGSLVTHWKKACSTKK
jgi:endoglucanase